MRPHVLLAISVTLLAGCNSNHSASDSAKTDHVIVPSNLMPRGDCDPNYAETLIYYKLRPEQIEVKGVEDSDALGIGCAYRVIPAPGTKVLVGANISYRTKTM